MKPGLGSLGDLRRQAPRACWAGVGRHVSFQTPQDCHAIAVMLVVRQAGGGIVVGRARDQDRYDGPRSSFAGVEFVYLRRKLLMKLGRENETLESAWAGSCEHPSTFLEAAKARRVPQTSQES
jgi:hypothetical protein